MYLLYHFIKGVLDYMLRKASVVLSLILSIAIIFIGHRSWISSQEEIHRVSPTPIPDSEASETVNDSEEEEKNPENAEDGGDLTAIISNQPDNVQNIWIEHQKNGESVDITLVASQSAALTDENWASILENELTSIYEGVSLNITTIVHDGGSEQLVSDLEDENINLENQDIVLMELATLQDNGVLSTEDQVYYMNRFIEEFQSLFPDSYLFLQPSQPIYNATFYPEQVEAVQAASEEFNITYLDHWSEWPSMEDSELENYLTEDNDANELGHETWGTYLVNYFSGN